MFLVPFIKLVEVVSKLIRPITLGVRLAVNLLTGHLLLRMFTEYHCSKFFNFSFISYTIVFLFGLFIMFYETCVGFIQAFVYNLMIVQYLDEHTDK